MKDRILWIGLLIVVFLAAFGSDYLFSNEEELNEFSTYSYVGSLDSYEFMINPQGDHFLNWSITYKINNIMQEIKNYQTPYPYGPMDLIDIQIQDFRGIFQNSEMVYITRDVNLDVKTGSEIVVSLLRTKLRNSEVYLCDGNCYAVELCEMWKILNKVIQFIQNVK